MSEIPLKFPDWQAPLQKVVLEFDPAKLPEEIQKVETLIHERIQKLPQSADGQAERVAIFDAFSLLRIIKSDRLQGQDSSIR